MSASPVKDKAGNAYRSCTWTFNFVNQSNFAPLLNGYALPATTYSGNCDPSGNLGPVAIPDNNPTQGPVGIQGATNTQWQVVICAQTVPGSTLPSPAGQPSNPCFRTTLTITGATQDITAALQAASILLNPLANPLLNCVPQTVTFSATPTFDASSFCFFQMTLTGNVTSSTISNPTTGRIISFQFTQDATGGRTFAWPASVSSPPSISTAANAVSTVTLVYGGANWILLPTGIGVVAPTIGPSAAQQHTIPAVASDTYALLAAVQALSGKTFDISANTLKNSTNTAGHYPRNNGTQYVDAAIAGADVPATTSNCSGVQFAQGLSAGLTPVCATPPTFVASGASHSVGYVPDPGSSAGTTRFLREDATWQAASGGVTESTLSWGAASQTQPTSACTENSTGNIQCLETFFANAHTLVRLTYTLYTAAVGCSPNAVIGLQDVTASSTVSSLTVATGAGFKDSGALSVAMTAGHKYGLWVITGASGCTTTPSVGGLTAVFQ